MAFETKGEVTLVVEDEQIICSKFLLKTHSDYFKAMFKSDMKERNAQDITLHGVSAKALQTIIKCLSFSKSDARTDMENALDIHSENVDTLLATATMLNFTGVVNQCCSYLQENMDPDNCLHVMTLADQFCLNELYNTSKAFSLFNFSSVVMSDGFLLASLSCVRDFLSATELNADSEDKVLKSALSWLHSDYRDAPCSETRNGLFECIRLAHVTKPAFGELCKTCLGCSEVLRKTYELTDKSAIPGRQVPYHVCFAGFRDSTPDYLDVSVFDWSKDELQTLTQLPHPRVQGCKVCVIGIDLYVTGGELKIGSGKWMTKVWHCCTLDKKWTEVGSLTQPRRHHSVAVHDTSFFLIGGFGRHRVLLDSVEQFNISSGEWSTLKPLPTPTYSAAATFCNDHLFVIKHEIQCYNLSSEDWTFINIPMPFEIGITCAMPHTDVIYLVGMFSSKLYAFNMKQQLVEEVNTGTRDTDLKCGPVCMHSDDVYLCLHDNFPGDDMIRNVAKYSMVQETYEVKDVRFDVLSCSAVCLPVYPGYR